ncbi:HD domain-containing protein [Glaciecola sp. SC05]|uniref:HD domain-containing protein n=1 Tax=Glaciecola sp. SC05 TaxID=1987355 RepID=UPI00352991C1
MNLKITGAFNLAAQAHGHQTRKYDGSSYTLHLKEVYLLLEYAGVQDEKVLIAGLLHDTLEDTALTAAEIEAQFGGEVCSIVQSLTDDKTASFASRKAAAIVKVRTLSGGALSIKLADLISNMTAIPAAWDAKKIAEYMNHCHAIIDAARQNSRIDEISGKLLNLADFFYKAQTSGCEEYFELCDMAERGLLFWNDDDHYFVIATDSSDSNVACKLANGPLDDSFRLGLLRGLKISDKRPQTMSVTWEQTQTCDEPTIYHAAIEVQCQRVMLKT